ncbi:hypothetical protein ACIHDR_42905 [Nocardia sp. NPDC052278]|uniref:hypothetical protein n=1 Tax=unclassified Nocardia TaxID=2637762 RepID=UPI0036C681AE
MDSFAQITQRQSDSGAIEYWPAVNPEGMPAGNPGPETFEYYGTDRGARPDRENRCTAMSVLQELTLDLDAYLPLLTTPLPIVHGRGEQDRILRPPLGQTRWTGTSPALPQPHANANQLFDTGSVGGFIGALPGFGFLSLITASIGWEVGGIAGGYIQGGQEFLDAEQAFATGQP